MLFGNSARDGRLPFVNRLVTGVTARIGVLDSNAGEFIRLQAFAAQNDGTRESMIGEQAELLGELQNLGKTALNSKQLMEEMAQRLHEKKARYNWVGFYVVDPKDSGFLIVGLYVGSFSPNVRIPLDTGLCGAAASTGKTVIVDDVTKDPVTCRARRWSARS